MLELIDVVWRLVAENLDRVLVAEPVRALDRVIGVLDRVVFRGVAERCVDPALGRTGVTPDRVELREQGHIDACVVSFDCRSHAR